LGWIGLRVYIDARRGECKHDSEREEGDLVVFERPPSLRPGPPPLRRV